jgi:hypothetical protein
MSIINSTVGLLACLIIHTCVITVEIWVSIIWGNIITLIYFWSKRISHFSKCFICYTITKIWGACNSLVPVYNFTESSSIWGKQILRTYRVSWLVDLVLGVVIRLLRFKSHHFLIYVNITAILIILLNVMSHSVRLLLVLNPSLVFMMRQISLVLKISTVNWVVNFLCFILIIKYSSIRLMTLVMVVVLQFTLLFLGGTH